MLTGLSIRNVVLIEALELDFSAGLTVLTGETGAGKSILLDALGLALGERAESGLVRQGETQASVTASFAANDAAMSLIGANAIEADAGEPILVRRVVRSDGGSRAFVNDQPVSAALLRQLGTALVEIHGQHDDRGLLNPRGHRALLDAFAAADLSTLTALHAAWQQAEQDLEHAQRALADADRDREWLEHAVAELADLAPRPGEDEELAERRARMQRGERLAGDLGSIRERVDAADGALAQLRLAARGLQRIAGEHPFLADALLAIDRALIEGGLAEERLADAAAALAFDPAALEADEARLFALRGLARKHRVPPDDLPVLASELGARLAAIEAGGEGLAALGHKAAEARAAYLEEAEAVSGLRLAAAVRLDAAVHAELAPLKLDAARFRTAISRLPPEQWSAAGFDRVEFSIATNPGAPFAPLMKIASGGELSRFILALKVALASEGGATTIIFDEIDRGVGGAVSSAIGERLSRLAQTAQIIVVTHSPQVAARGDRHLLIAKRHADGLVTRTDVQALDEQARREEIARMLSGATVTDEARAQAERLLEAA